MPKAQYVHKTTKRYKKRAVEYRFWGKVLVKGPEDCWEWRGSVRRGFGYGQFSFNGYPELSHRVAWILRNGPIPEDSVVCHSCDNPLCVNPAHLFIGSQLTNIRDMISKSRDALIGERNNRAKLTEKLVLEARLLRRTGTTFAEIGRRFNLDRRTISEAVNRKTWKHVK